MQVGGIAPCIQVMQHIQSPFAFSLPTPRSPGLSISKIITV